MSLLQMIMVRLYGSLLLIREKRTVCTNETPWQPFYKLGMDGAGARCHQRAGHP
jgi:hypothetical protein